jgi:hypothetical protein
MNTGPEVAKHRVVTMLSRQEIEFLDKLGKDALFSTGHKLTYNKILRALIDFAMEMGISGEKIDSFNKLKEKIFKQISERCKNKKEIDNENAF